MLRFFGASDATADRWAGIAYGGARIAGAPGMGMAVRGMAGAAAATARVGDFETSFGPKIGAQLGKRGRI